MSRYTKAKRAKQKEKKLEKAQADLKENQVKFDIITLLMNEQIDTKPNLGKFLKQYVKMIRCLNQNSKICFYPNFSYEMSKVFVKFLDGHELIFDMKSQVPENTYFLYFETDEIEMSKKDKEYVKRFFDFLFQFKFVF